MCFPINCDIIETVKIIGKERKSNVKKPTYKELLTQVSVYKNRIKYLSEHTERVEKQNEKLVEDKKNLTEEKKKLSAEIKQLTIDYNWVLEQLKLSKKKSTERPQKRSPRITVR